MGEMVVMTQSQDTNLPVAFTALERNKSSQQLAIRRAEVGVADYVVHLSID